MQSFKLAMRWLLGLLFMAAGIAHFLRPDFYRAIMPPYLPWHRELVFLSGVLELFLGFLVLIPRTRPLAAWGLIALLIAVFPANVHMALHPTAFPTFSPAALWARLPVQGLLILWAYWFTRPHRPAATEAPPPSI
jgi:uncharacterized membrane protein